MCDGLGRQFSYICPKNTLFLQRMLICDHWYMVSCNKSAEDYTANLLIGQSNKPFVDDSDEQVYRRTPRPDFLHSDHKEYEAESANDKPYFRNLVGLNLQQNLKGGSHTTEKAGYSLPSHWFTEYSKDHTTERTIKLKSRYYISPDQFVSICDNPLRLSKKKVTHQGIYKVLMINKLKIIDNVFRLRNG